MHSVFSRSAVTEVLPLQLFLMENVPIFKFFRKKCEGVCGCRPARAQREACQGIAKCLCAEIAKCAPVKRGVGPL